MIGSETARNPTLHVASLVIPVRRHTPPYTKKPQQAGFGRIGLSPVPSMAITVRMKQVALAGLGEGQMVARNGQPCAGRFLSLRYRLLQGPSLAPADTFARFRSPYLPPVAVGVTGLE